MFNYTHKWDKNFDSYTIVTTRICYNIVTIKPQCLLTALYFDTANKLSWNYATSFLQTIQHDKQPLQYIFKYM